MSLEMKKECVKTGDKLKEASFEQRIDMDIALPDYCADIKKILRCTLVPGIHTVSQSGERASARGTGTVRIIYLTEGDKADVFEKSWDLSSSVQFSELSPEAIVRATAVVDFVNCRAVSQRKISVSASVSTIFTLYGAREEFFVIGDEKNSIQVKKEKLVCEVHHGFFEKTFDLSETVALSSEHPPVGKIVSCNSRIVNESHKLSSGKLLVKGDAVTDILYIPEKAENALHTYSHTMPVSQIIDLKNVPDGALCSLEIKTCQLLCSLKADSSGSNRLIDIALRVSAFVNAYEKKECEVITDCYCTDYETQESFELSGMRCPVRAISEARQTKVEAELSAPVKEVGFASCTEITKNIRYTEDKVQLDCSAVIFMLCTDENGIPCCNEKNIDFDFSYSVVKKCNDPSGSFSLEPVNVSVAVSSDGKAEITLDYNVTGKVYGSFGKKILKSMSVLEDKPRSDGKSALTVYFAEAGEKLWDIARGHNTTVELVRQENGIDAEELGEKMMLLIPCG